MVDSDKKIFIAEIKINPDRINPADLKRKSVKLVDYYKGYDVEYAGLSVNDLDDFLLLYDSHNNR